MIFKVILLLVVLSVSLIYDYFTRMNKRKVFFFLVIVLTSFFAFREYMTIDVGTDYYEYRIWFDSINGSNFLHYGIKDLGFNVLVYISKLIFDNYIFFQFVCGLIINSLMLSFIKRNFEKITLPMMIYLTFCYFSIFNITRQWIACSIIIYSLKYIENKNIFKFLGLCLLASLFHNSAIFLVLLYPILLNGKYNMRYIIKIVGIILIGIVLFIYSDNVVYYLLMSNMLTLENYSHYIDYTSGLSNFTFVIICSVILFFILMFSKKTLITDNDRSCVVFLILAIVVGALGTKSFIFSRYSVYFIPSIIIALPSVLKALKSNDSLLGNLTIFIFLLFIYF